MTVAEGTPPDAGIAESWLAGAAPASSGPLPADPPTAVAAPRAVAPHVAEASLAEAHGTDAAVLLAGLAPAVACTLLAMTNPGGHVVASRTLVGAVRDFLRDDFAIAGRSVTFVDATDADAVAAAVVPATQLVLVESLSDPQLRPAPVNDLATFAQSSDLVLVVDNSALSPALFRPGDAGATAVIEDCSRYVDPQHAARAACVLGFDPQVALVRTQAARLAAAADPWSAGLVADGLVTLPDRMRLHDANAERAEDLLAAHEGVAVRRPSFDEHLWARETHRGFGALVAVTFDPAHFDAAVFAAAFDGDGGGPGTTSASLPAATSHSGLTPRELDGLGVGPDLVRLHAGVEPPDELAARVERALDAARVRATSTRGVDTPPVGSTGVDVPAMAALAARVERDTWDAQYGVAVLGTALPGGIDVAVEPASLGATRVVRRFRLAYDGEAAAIRTLLAALAADVGTTAIASLTLRGRAPDDVRVRARLRQSGGVPRVKCDVAMSGSLGTDAVDLAIEHARRYSPVHSTIVEADPIRAVVAGPARATYDDLGGATAPPVCPESEVTLCWTSGTSWTDEESGRVIDQPRQLFGADRGPSAAEHVLAALTAEFLAGVPASGTQAHTSGRLDLRGALGVGGAPVGLRNVVVQALPAAGDDAAVTSAVDAWQARGVALHLVREAHPVDVTARLL